jgi:hypothetical protein
MASHLSMRMAEVMRGRGEELPSEASAADGAPSGAASAKPRGLTDRLLRRRR